MARNIRLMLGRKQVAEAIEEDASGAEFTDYQSEPSTEPEHHAPDYAMPLFLSEGAEQIRRRGIAIGWNWDWKDAALRQRVIKAGVLVAAAAAIAFGLIYLEDSLDLFATARASLFGRSTDQSVITETSTQDAVAASVQSTSSSPSPFTPSTVGVRTGSSTARGTPSREDISVALRTARQGQSDTGQPLGAMPTARGLNADEVPALIRRAKGLIAFGDIVAARLLLERAAHADDADAALLLAQTYDPAVLGKPDVRTITPDPAIARGWYQRAAALGSLNAKQRLAQMQN
jgi:hypothetical protein